MKQRLGHHGIVGVAFRAWPEPRLTYANAVIPEAQLAIGQALGDERSLTLGLRMLQWLVEL